MEEDGLRMCAGRRSERSGASSSSSSISYGIVMIKVLYVVLPKEDVKSCKFHSAFVKKIRSIDAPAQS